MKCSISYVFGLLKNHFSQKRSSWEEEEKEMWAQSSGVCKWSSVIW